MTSDKSGPFPQLPDWLGKPQRFWLASPLAILFTIPVALLFGLIGQQLFPAAAPPNFDHLAGLAGLFALVVFAPVTETIILGAVLMIAQRFVSPWTAAWIGAIGFGGIAHSLAAPTWGLSIWFPFLIFSIQFIVWRQRGPLWAFFVPALTHALHNLGPALLVLYGPAI